MRQSSSVSATRAPAWPAYPFDVTVRVSLWISMLVVAHRKATASNAELRLVVISTTVLRALTLVRLDHLLPVYPGLAEALELQPGADPG